MEGLNLAASVGTAARAGRARANAATWPRRAVLRRLVGAAGLLALVAAAVPTVFFRGPAPGLAANGAGEVAGAGANDLRSVLGAINGALSQIAPLEEQVAAGNLVPEFGSKAQEILTAARRKAGASAAPQVERAVDGALQTLFLRQVATLGQQVASKFGDADGLDVPIEADEQFLAEASPLVRPGSDWSFERERGLLHARVEGGLRHRAGLVEERARAARLQHATIEVIGKMQEKMERLAQKVQGARSGGSPWVLSTSYRVPKTPLQLVGRYEQGRANVELNLTPEQDPGKTEASFADGIGPANIGVSFNLGI